MKGCVTNMPEGLDKLASGLGKAIETVPELYADAFQPAVQETGKLIARIPHAINAAFSGLDKWILHKEYSIEETKKLLAQKLENVEPEKIVEPEPYVAIPALQAISYSMNSDELRNLYANLLAKSMNIDTKDMVHPSFVEIIKQMSPIDAHVLKEISFNSFIQTVDIYCSKYSHLQIHSNSLSPLENPIERHGYERLTHITSFSPDVVNISLDNLLRLRLIEERFTYNTHSIDEKIQKSSNYKTMAKQLQKFMVDDTWKYEEFSQCFYLTNFGKSFCEICLEIS